MEIGDKSVNVLKEKEVTELDLSAFEDLSKRLKFDEETGPRQTYILYVYLDNLIDNTLLRTNYTGDPGVLALATFGGEGLR